MKRFRETVLSNGLIPHPPTPKQARLLARDDVREALYGGAAGGGKSDALLMAAAQYAHVPGYAALLLRRSFPDLMRADGLIPRSKEWWSGQARWSPSEKRWTFPSGATVTFGYLERDDDVYQYQGAAFQLIGFDELTQHTEARYRYLFSRLRRPSGGPLSAVPLRMRAATNPGGKGHEWVKKRFVPDGYLRDKTPARFGRAWWQSGRLFVPARLEDNPHLDAASYEAGLAQLLPVQRAQLREGDWSAHEGGHFKREWFREYRDNADSWCCPPDVWVKRDCSVVVAVDPSGGVSEHADPTAMVVGAVTPKNDLLILDVVRERLAVEHVVPRLADVCLRWSPDFVVVETGFLQSAYVREARQTRGVPTVHAIDPGGKSKLVRATPAVIRARAGQIWLPPAASWLDAYLSELCSFTGDDRLDAYDDQVDATSHLVAAIDRFHLAGDDGGPVLFGRRAK
jgi:predicted phage terminase large subunit-like protein